MLYLYYGEDLYALEKHLVAFRERYLARYTSGLNLWAVDLAGDLAFFREALAAYTMFEERRLILGAGALSVPASRWEEIVGYLTEHHVGDREDVVVVLYDKTPPRTLKDKVGRVGFAKKTGTVKEFVRPKGAALVRWLEGELRARKGSAERGTLEELTLRVGNDTIRLVHELEKLITHAGNRKITVSDVKLLTVSRARPEMFKTLDALSQKNARAALEALGEHLLAGEDALKLLGMLAYQIRILLEVKEAEDSPRALSALKLHPFVLKKNRAYARNFSREELLRLHHELAMIDRALKSSQLEGADALQDFVLRATSRPAQRSA